MPAPRTPTRTDTAGAGAGAGDLARLRVTSPLYDAVIEEVKGRRIRIGDHWLIDFASCNYLGFDLDAEIIDTVAEALARWGTHPSWSRLLGSPRPYIDIEEQLTDLLGSQDALLLPTITHIHQSVIPALAGSEGWVFLDRQAHRSMYDGCRIARGAGASLQRFPTDDVDALGAMLRAAPARATKLICTDGVNSMTGNSPDIAAFARLAREHGALLYIDDAHGFGVIGQRTATEPCPYGIRGNSVVRYSGESYDNIVLVGGFSKAYSSLLAFLALPTALKDHLKTAAAPYLYSGPSPTACLATALAGLAANRARGDALRADLHRRTAQVLDTVTALDLTTPNRSGLPIIEIPAQDAGDIEQVGRLLYDAGIYATLAAYPLVPRAEVGFRLQITAANTEDEIAELCHVLRTVAETGILRRHSKRR